jgi:hypothetical protein
VSTLAMLLYQRPENLDPQIVAIRLTPMIQFHDASVQCHIRTDKGSVAVGLLRASSVNRDIVCGAAPHLGQFGRLRNSREFAIETGSQMTAHTTNNIKGFHCPLTLFPLVSQ